MNNKDALARAISLTDEILSVLDNQEFERISELETQRESFIHQAFAGSVERIDQIKAKHLQNLNQQVVEKLSEFKHSVLAQQKHIRAGSKATRAYASHR